MDTALKEQLTRAADARDREADLAAAQVEYYRTELVRLEAEVAQGRADAAAIRNSIGVTSPDVS